jgi:hypothetical protein
MVILLNTIKVLQYPVAIPLVQEQKPANLMAGQPVALLVVAVQRHVLQINVEEIIITITLLLMSRENA